MGAKEQQDPMVALPRYVVSESEWAAVPRTVPDRLLRWGSLVPYYALLAIGLKSGLGTGLDHEADPYVVGALLSWGFCTAVSARLTPWICLLGTAVLYFSQQQTALFAALWWAASLWLLLLGLAGGMSGMRLTMLVRSWRQQGSGQTMVSRALLRESSMHRRAGRFMRKFAGTLLALVLIKVVVSYFTSASRDLAAVPGTFGFEDLDHFVIPLLALCCWFLVGALHLAQVRIAGDVVLEIPLDPAIGPLVFQRAAQCVDLAEAQREGCSCGGKERSAPGGMPPVLALDDRCPVHGINAVNALGHREFLAVANEPWVWGANVAKLPVPAHARLSIVGLHAWESRPAVPGTPVRRDRKDAATHTGFRPWRAMEVLNRAGRTVRRRNLADCTPDSTAIGTTGVAVIDSIGLEPAGLPGYAVRVAGARPEFETGPMPRPNRYAGTAAATPVSRP